MWLMGTPKLEAGMSKHTETSDTAVDFIYVCVKLFTYRQDV